MKDSIAESAQVRLRNSPYFALRDIGCTWRDGTLELRGRLPSYYLKQMAQMLVADVVGGTAIVNSIEVTAPALRQEKADEVLLDVSESAQPRR